MTNTTKIEKLTPEQEAQIPHKRDEWLEIGLSTEPSNRAEAERGIKLAYEAAGLEMPAEVLWLESPYAAEKYIKDNNLPACTPCYGFHDAGWLSYYDYFGEVVGLADIVKPLEGQMIAAKNAGWWYAYDELVIVTDRPIELHRDPEGRLHNEDGAAVLYGDGYGVYVVNGIRVPKDIILNKASLTVERIMGENNAEVRRVMAQLYGWDRFLVDAGGDLLDDTTDGLGHPLQLWKIELDDEPEPIVMLVCTNSTPEPDGSHKTYSLRVAPDHTDAFTAQASLFMMTADEYDLAMET